MLFKNKKEIEVEKEIIKEVEVEKPLVIKTINLPDIHYYRDDTKFNGTANITFTNYDYSIFAYFKVPKDSIVIRVTTELNPNLYATSKFGFKFVLDHQIGDSDMYKLLGSWVNLNTTNTTLNTSKIYILYY